MEEELKKKIKELEKRIEALEEYLEELPAFQKPVSQDQSEEQDELYDKALWVVLQHEMCSASLLQRRLQIGYNRAARLLAQLEENGIVGPPNGSEPRKVLVGQEDIDLLRKTLEEKRENASKKKKSN